MKRIFLLKFAKPDNRQSLVIDSGFRCHLTDYTRATAAAPSAFVARLRKFLRTRRVTSVLQIGTDRIIEIQFSDGQYRLFLEFYAGGNIVLTDEECNIISLLRVVNEANEQLRVGLKYSLQNRQNYDGVPILTQDRVRIGLQRAVAKEGGDNIVPQKRSKKPGDALRKALATSLTELPPLVIDHALRVANFDPKTPAETILEDPCLMDKLVAALEEAQKVVSNVTSSGVCRGYIIAKPANTSPAATQNQITGGEVPTQATLMYEDFHPFRPKQFEDNPETTILEFDGFNKTVDEFFSSIESQKISSRLTEREENARRKLASAKLDHERRLDGLQQVQGLNVRKAQAIEANLQRVQEAIAAVNGLLAQGMDWMDVGRLIEMEQSKHNVVAEMIRLPLKLYENSVTLLLAETRFDGEDDYEGDETDSDISDSTEDERESGTKLTEGLKSDDKRLMVDVDLALSPWSNARLYYDQKKSAAVKEQKTLQSSEKALKSTEKKVTADLKKGLKQEKEVMRPQRKALWFEKFLYFISSEGYLVIGGKDAPQNEILYKRYLKKGDVYVHADLHGAASVIIKNKIGMMDSPIPPSTLSQAGTLAVATSSAWDSKAGMSAWWVQADEVSKTTPTGEYLTNGAFTVRGHKNFLPPAQLLLGFGILFKISEESKARHLKHRIRDEEPAASDVTAKSNEGNGFIEENDFIERTASNESLHSRSEQGEDEATEMARTDQVESSSENEDEARDIDTGLEQNNPLQPIPSRQHSSHSQDPNPGSNSAQTSLGSKAPTDSQSPDQDSDNDIQSLTQDSGETHAAEDRKRHLSAKERRLLRRGLPTSVQDNSEPPNRTIDSEENTKHSDPETSFQSNTPVTKSHPAVRGKHGKLNKLKSKYADQDDEDRVLAMRLLGSAAAQAKATDEAAAKVAKEQELAELKERRRRQHELAAARGKESEELRRLNFEEGLETLENGEMEESEDLDAFVGAPLPGDEILDVLVMSGPWDAIGGRCRWRVKLQPGTMKKGKAVREILNKWLSTISEGEKKRRPGSGDGNEAMMEEEKVRRREAELIRAIREPEVIGVVPVGKVRVVMGPGEAGAKGKGGGGGGGKGKGKRGGKGSKK